MFPCRPHRDCFTVFPSQGHLITCLESRSDKRLNPRICLYTRNVHTLFKYISFVWCEKMIIRISYFGRMRGINIRAKSRKPVFFHVGRVQRGGCLWSKVTHLSKCSTFCQTECFNLCCVNTISVSPNWVRVHEEYAIASRNTVTLHCEWRPLTFLGSMTMDDSISWKTYWSGCIDNHTGLILRGNTLHNKAISYI